MSLGFRGDEGIGAGAGARIKSWGNSPSGFFLFLERLQKINARAPMARAAIPDPTPIPTMVPVERRLGSESSELECEPGASVGDVKPVWGISVGSISEVLVDVIVRVVGSLEETVTVEVLDTVSRAPITLWRHVSIRTSG